MGELFRVVGTVFIEGDPLKAGLSALLLQSIHAGRPRPAGSQVELFYLDENRGTGGTIPVSGVMGRDPGPGWP